MAETFMFTRHKRKVEYLNNTNKIELGNGYSYVSSPNGPLLKKFTLKFSGFRFYFDSQDKLDHDSHKYENNMAALCDFYETMNLDQTFIYNDFQYGAVEVRFAEPLVVPNSMGPNAVLEDFELVLNEVSR